MEAAVGYRFLRSLMFMEVIGSKKASFLNDAHSAPAQTEQSNPAKAIQKAADAAGLALAGMSQSP